ncbi:MAG TPA: PilT/PilU family type 4a pilus ATPase [Polyangiales bacterium]|jgi:twitching motility protein PilT
MLASKLFQLLARPEVAEIVLIVGKPPCARVDDSFRRLSANLLREEDVMVVLAAAQGQHHLARLADGSRWDFQLPSVGTIHVSAVYDGPILKASLKLSAAKASAIRADEAFEPLQEETELELIEPAPPPRRRVRESAPPAPVERAPLHMKAAPERAYALPDPEPQAFDRISVPQRMAAAVNFRGDVLEQLLGRARQLRASDIHLLADRPPMLRIAGELVPQPEVISPALAEQLLLSRVPEALRPVLQQQGSCDFALNHDTFGRFRANVSLQRTGWKLTARPIGENVPTLQELGLPESIANALHHHQGLIVIAGATGQGKTTTLAALVGLLNRDTAHHVITVEDPIEYVHETARAMISQREVGTHTKSFASALKASLREDPDVIVVGELRDTETVRMALSASETGHLVISTMNTPSAAKAIERLIDLFPPGDQPQVRMTLAGGLRMIISQRLIPTADRTQLCAAAEVLPGSTPLWSLIRENRTYQIASLQQRGKSLGIIRLDDSLAQLVKSNRTTFEIAREYCESVEQLESTIKGRPAIARPDAAENNSDPNNLQKRGMDLGKQVFSRAGKLFGGENK